MKILKMMGVGIILVVIMAFASIAFIFYDMNSRSTVYETLDPNEAVIGSALVVYDPSITGNTKNVADIIAGELQTKGYKVDVVGINNPKARNTSRYNVIVVGGPIYGGNTGDAVKIYLETLKPPEGTKIGVFATGDPHTTDEAQIKIQVATIPENSSLQINAVMTVSMNDDKTKKCAIFVDNLLK